MNERWKNILIVVLSVLLLLASLSIWYDSNRAAESDSRDVTRTIQQLKEDNLRIRRELEAAREQLQSGQAGISRAEERTGKLEESNQQSGELIEHSRELIDGANQTFADIDRASGIPQTQNSCQGTSK